MAEIGGSLLLDSDMDIAEVAAALEESEQEHGQQEGRSRSSGPSCSVSASQVLAAQLNAPLNHRTVRKNWSEGEDMALKKGVATYGERNWKAVAEMVQSRNHTQCMQRWSKALKPGLKKGHWTNAEDDILREMAQTYDKNWAKVVHHIPGRTVKQIRERWSNHVNPIINHSSFTEEEDKLLVEMHEKVGNKWALIAKSLHNRTAEGVKIRWKSLCRKSKQELKRKEQQRQHEARMQQYQVQTQAVGDGYVSPPSASSCMAGCSPPFGPTSSSSTSASKQPPSLLRLSRHILVGLDTSDAGLARAPGSPLVQASPPKKARTFSYCDNGARSPPVHLGRQGRSQSVGSTASTNQFLSRSSSVSDPVPYRDPTETLNALMGAEDDDEHEDQSDDFQLPAPLPLTVTPGLHRSHTEPAPANRSYSASLNRSPTSSSSSSSSSCSSTRAAQSQTELSEVQQAEAEAEAEAVAELGELLGQLEEIEAQQEEQERVQAAVQAQAQAQARAQQQPLSSPVQMPAPAPVHQRTPMPHHQQHHQQRYQRGVTAQLQTGLKSCPSLKLTDSLKNLFLSDMDIQVLDDAVERLGEDEIGDDNGEDDSGDDEEVTVMVSESDIENSHRNRNSNSSNSNIISSSTSRGIARSNNRNNSSPSSSPSSSSSSSSSTSNTVTAAVTASARPNLLIRAPSFNRVLSNLTNSPLASQPPFSLARSMSNKSLLGGESSSISGIDSPTVRDFELLSEHLQDNVDWNINGDSPEKGLMKVDTTGSTVAVSGGTGRGGKMFGLRVNTNVNGERTVSI